MKKLNFWSCEILWNGCLVDRNHERTDFLVDIWQKTKLVSDYVLRLEKKSVHSYLIKIQFNSVRTAYLHRSISTIVKTRYIHYVHRLHRLLDTFILCKFGHNKYVSFIWSYKYGLEWCWWNVNRSRELEFWD